LEVKITHQTDYTFAEELVEKDNGLPEKMRILTNQAMTFHCSPSLASIFSAVSTFQWSKFRGSLPILFDYLIHVPLLKIINSPKTATPIVTNCIGYFPDQQKIPLQSAWRRIFILTSG